MSLTKVSGGILDPGINVAGIVTATGFDGPFVGGSDGINAGVVTATTFSGTTFSGAFSGDGSALTGVANTDVIFPDKISLGDANSDGTDGDMIAVGLSSDLRIYHNGSNSYLDNQTGGLFIDQNVDDSDITFRCDDGSGGTTVYLTLDGGLG